ncbi:MAG TPA: hypothetical protein VF559_08305 [Caulobacteraceae bacterium]
MSYRQDARWFLERIEGERARFVFADRDALSAEPFLDHRWSSEGLRQAFAPLAEVEDTPPAPVQVHFLWHTSFCRSTLIAGCLDWPGRCLSLREPWVLVHLADLKRASALARRPRLASAVFGLIGRRFHPQEVVLIKPSNGANTLIPEAASATSGKMLMLHAGQRQFLVSMVKNGGSQARFVREMLLVVLADRRNRQIMPADELLRLTDLQAAALLWQIQTAHLRQAAQHLGERAATLDAETFLEDPKRALLAVDGFYGLDLGPEVIDLIMQGSKLKQDSKRAGVFESKDDLVQAVEALTGSDIDRAIAWSRKATGQQETTPMPQPLLGHEQSNLAATHGVGWAVPQPRAFKGAAPST